MAQYTELVQKYKKRQKDTLLDTVSTGLSFADNVAVDLGLLEDAGVLADTLETVSTALPFALVAVTEQCKVILGKTTQRAAAENTVYRLVKTGAAMGAGALAFAAGGPAAAIPTAMSVRVLMDQYKSKALLGARVHNRTERLRGICTRLKQRQLGFVPGEDGAYPALPCGVELVDAE
ncbi:MAG: hypothetical protein IKT57_06390 [Clostridia bacterium]|nr:hypothetical protein [Clostridia bacterium]